MNPESLVKSRAETHGNFNTTATIAQNLKAAASNPHRHMTANQKEALDLICTKMARILSGDPNNPDHWDDIAGYAALGKDGDR